MAVEPPDERRPCHARRLGAERDPGHGPLGRSHSPNRDTERMTGGCPIDHLVPAYLGRTIDPAALRQDDASLTMKIVHPGDGRDSAASPSLDDMSSRNGNSRAEPAAPAVQVAAAERFAEAIVIGFEVCEQGGMPLSQIQKIALIEAALLEFDGLEAQLNSLAIVGEMLHELGRDQRKE